MDTENKNDSNNFSHNFNGNSENNSFETPHNFESHSEPPTTSFETQNDQNYYTSQGQEPSQEQDPVIDDSSHLHDSSHDDRPERKSERFIMSALISGVIITACIIGFGWALFYPKNDIQSVVKEKPLVKEEQTAQAQENAETTKESTDVAQNEDGDVVIIYGGDEESNDLALEKDQNTTVASVETPSSTSATQSVKKASPTHTVQKVTQSTAVKKAPARTSASATSTEKTSVVIREKANVANTAKPQTPTKPQTLPRTTTTQAQSPKATSAKPTQTVFWVQVFATSNKNKANTLKGDLEKNGITASIITKNINKKTFYRLRIGPYYNKNEGNKFLDWIKQSEKYKDAYVTQTYI